MSSTHLVIGGTTGVGRALSERLSENNAVHVMARSEDKLDALKTDLGAQTTAVNAMDADALAAAVETAAGDALDGLAYCVGSIDLKPLRRTAPEDFVNAYRLNVVGAAAAIRAAAPALKKANGSVVLFSTVAAGQGFQNHSVIAAAKGGVEALARSLAAELAPQIRVNCIALSLTKTPLAAPVIGNEAMEKALGEAHPLRRLGAPADAAAMAAFLMSPEAGWISGQIFNVDGGRSTLRPKG
ncbi:MAG: SDR family oxidoreductase [Pseudomonadota bacterium]